MHLLTLMHYQQFIWKLLDFAYVIKVKFGSWSYAMSSDSLARKIMQGIWELFDIKYVESI